MDDRQRASQWVAMYADNNALARHRQAVDSLTALLDSVRREALEPMLEVLRLVNERCDCGDNSCLFAKSKGGMRTNGGCRCVERGHGGPALAKLVRAVRALATPTKPGDEP